MRKYTESIEITDIPYKIKDEDLENQVIKIYQIADGEVHGELLCIVVCHRIGKKGKTIVRFINRKFAKEIFVGKTIRADKYYKKININNSFSKEFGMFHFHIRPAAFKEEKND